jgi:hypothetical protein
MKMFRFVYPKAVERACADVRGSGKISIGFALEWLKQPPGIFFGAFFQDKIDILRLGRP